MKRHHQQHPVLAKSGGFSPELRPFGSLQSHSYLCPLQKSASGHPNIGQRKQSDELRRVFLEPAIAHPGEAELAFDNSERVLHFGSHTGLEPFGLLAQRTPRRVLVRLALARPHGNVPIHARGFRALGSSLITGISKHDGLFAVQQSVSLGHVVDVGRCSDDGVHKARICVDSDMRLHAKVPLVALFDLVHLRITLTCAVFGRAGCRNQGGINYAASLEQQALGGQLGVDHLQDLRAQLVLFEQMTKSQDADSVRNSLCATDPHEVTVEAGLEQSLFGSKVRQTEPLLQTMNAQHHCQIKWRASRLGDRCVWRDQRQQITPRHDLLHRIEQDLLARSARTQIEAKVFLFHAINPRNLRAPDPTDWGGVLNMILRTLLE